MRIRNSIVLLLISVGLNSIIAGFQSTPGYMDADYYTMVGLNLAEGEGFTSEVIWNYLDQPTGIPHPAHAYWMPLASMMSALGVAIRPNANSFEAAQWIFVLAASMVPLLTAKLSFALWQREDVAKLAGGLALFSGFYAAFMTTSDTFGIYMLLGSAYFWIMVRAVKRPTSGLWVAVGILTGLMHLARADGVIWLLASGGYLFIKHRGDRQGDDIPSRDALQKMLWKVLLLIFGYAVVMVPWFWRNMNEFGVMLNPGGLKTIWMKEYNDLFLYPSGQINFASWWGTGLREIIGDRILALWQNIQTMVAVQGMIFLMPLMIAGWWKYRKQEAAQLAAFIWILTLLLMTVVFPYSGARGGYFHAGAGLQPIAWGLAGVGFYEFIDWGCRRRGWRKEQAGVIFKMGAIGFAALLTAVLVIQKFQGEDGGFGGWNQYAMRYEAIEEMIENDAPDSNSIVMVINPPGYHLASGRWAIAIPTGGEEALYNAASKFEVSFLVVEINHPPELEKFYYEVEDRAEWRIVGTVEGATIYRRVNGRNP